MEQKDVVIIGGGPAGLAAAVELHKQGIRNMIILEREAMLGGILRQCIHDGFGLGRFGESLSGPEYAQAFIDEVNKREIPYETSATVLSLRRTVLSPPPPAAACASIRQRLWCLPWAARSAAAAHWAFPASVRRACSPQAPRRLT